MPEDTAITAVAHTIQLAVAPVFLLTGVAGMLGVLTNRLARVIDRGRALHENMSTPNAGRAAVDDEIRVLSVRAKLINYAITCCTLTALLVCAVIATLFVGAFSPFDASVPVAVLFVAGMVALCVGLLFFVREIFIATATLRIGPH